MNDTVENSRYLQVVIPMGDGREFQTACMIDDFCRVVIPQSVVMKYLDMLLNTGVDDVGKGRIEE